MNFKKFNIKGPILFQPKIFYDSRGCFHESFNKKQFEKISNTKFDFFQENISNSKKNVIRGLHFQSKPYEQEKVITVIKGSIYDVFVDLRKNSKTYKKYKGIFLDDIKKNYLWIPKGFAHGFMALKSNTIIKYLVNNSYQPNYEKTLIWNDPKIKIKWPKSKRYIISKKDSDGKQINEIENNVR